MENYPLRMPDGTKDTLEAIKADLEKKTGFKISTNEVINHAIRELAKTIKK